MNIIMQIENSFKNKTKKPADICYLFLPTLEIHIRKESYQNHIELAYKLKKSS
jgi:hypothetical protein